MSRKDYVPVGGILERNNGKKYEAVLGTCRCDGCAFEYKSDEWCKGMRCIPGHRPDKTSVIFKRRADLETTLGYADEIFQRVMAEIETASHIQLIKIDEILRG